MLIGNALREMDILNKKSSDNWLGRVDQFESLLKIPRNLFFSKSSGKKILKTLKSKFEIHFLKNINEFKPSERDTQDHNKLRTYRTFKSSFTREPYLDLVRNRNQRCFLSRLRVGSHGLQIELGRHTRPVTPIDQRYCKFCPPRPSPTCPSSTLITARSLPSAEPAVDTEFHFLIQCPMFKPERDLLFERLNQVNLNFTNLSLADKFKVMLCPTTAFTTKLIHRFIKQMFATRGKHAEKYNL